MTSKVDLQQCRFGKQALGMQVCVAVLCIAVLCIAGLADPSGIHAQEAEKTQPAADSELPIAVEAKLEKLADGFRFTEGPAADREGNVYFTDQPNNRILRWSLADQLSTFLEPAGRANGLFIDRQGGLWACADEQNELWRIDLNSGEHEVIVDQYAGHLFNGPNDCWVHPSGDVYFTDPFYKRPYWERGEQEQDQQAVYRWDAQARSVTRVAGDFVKPNGVIGSPDGKFLYVADIGDNKTYRLSITDEGALVDRQLFCPQGSDGMTLDRAGNVYLTGRGVTIYNRQGKRLQQLDVPENWTANVCFGGKEHRFLFITASTGLYRVATRTQGTSFVVADEDR